MSPSIRFANAEVRPSERQLLIDGKPATLGSRASDLLLALVERRERLVRKNELLDLVWPDTVVEENDLQSQVSQLRKLLGPQAISTIPGRGYRFTATVDESPSSGTAAAPQAAGAPQGEASTPPTTTALRTNLPAVLPSLIGRDDDLLALGALIDRHRGTHRLITISGAGGIGKTRVAQTLLQARTGAFAHGVCFVVMQDVVSLGADVIVTTGGPGVRAALGATDKIAIVGLIDDPLDAGLIDSLARPGHNLTGIGDPLLHGKLLQLLKDAAPAISRVGVIAYRPLPGPRARWRVELDAQARGMRLDLLWLAVDAPEDLDAAFATITREHADALYAPGTHVNYAYRHRIGDFALKQRLPSAGILDGGLLLSYESDYLDTLRRAAGYAKKILNGAKPGDLPFEQPTKYKLTINLKTAKALGLTIPQWLLLRADEVIE